MSSFTDLNLNFGSVTVSWAHYIELEDLNPFSFECKGDDLFDFRYISDGVVRGGFPPIFQLSQGSAVDEMVKEKPFEQ